MNDRENPGTRLLLDALGHPLRRAILKEVASTEMLSPQEFSGRVGVPVSKVSYHFRKLAEHEAIVLVKVEPARGSLKHYYRFTVEEPWALEALGLASPPS
jgi:DNA-binding transcriptional ArsR family regulator